MWEERIVNIIVGHRSFCCCSEVQVYLYYCSSFFTSWHNGFFFFPMSDLVPIVPRTGPAKACLTPAMGRVWSFLQLWPRFHSLVSPWEVVADKHLEGAQISVNFPLEFSAFLYTARRVLICYQGRGMLLLLRCQAQNLARGLAVPLCQEETEGKQRVTQHCNFLLNFLLNLELFTLCIDRLEISMSI